MSSRGWSAFLVSWSVASPGAPVVGCFAALAGVSGGFAGLWPFALGCSPLLSWGWPAFPVLCSAASAGALVVGCFAALAGASGGFAGLWPPWVLPCLVGLSAPPLPSCLALSCLALSCFCLSRLRLSCGFVCVLPLTSSARGLAHAGPCACLLVPCAFDVDPLTDTAPLQIPLSVRLQWRWGDSLCECRLGGKRAHVRGNPSLR